MSIINKQTKSIDLEIDDPILGIRKFWATLFFIIIAYAILSFIGIIKHNILIYFLMIGVWILIGISIIITQILLKFIYQQTHEIKNIIDGEFGIYTKIENISNRLDIIESQIDRLEYSIDK